jgi:hypothetical protein
VDILVIKVPPYILIIMAIPLDELGNKGATILTFLTKLNQNGWPNVILRIIYNIP